MMESLLSDASVERAVGIQAVETVAEGSRFVRACLRLPVDRTPVWFLRQAGRYMPEYMAVRKHHTLLEICRTPEIAAEVTITAAERLGVDAAIIFADLLLPFTPMGLDFEFVAGEGPVVHTPVRSLEQVQALRTDRVEELSYVARAIEKVATHFAGPRADGDHAGDHRLLRRSVDAGELHDRGGQSGGAQLYRDQEADVQRTARRGRC
jgi:uroporphyrinogen decarboxylase